MKLYDHLGHKPKVKVNKGIAFFLYDKGVLLSMMPLFVHPHKYWIVFFPIEMSKIIFLTF